MTEQVSRRNFFKLVGGAVALAAAPGVVISKAIEIPVKFGWTWSVDKTKLSPDLSELVTKTLKANAPKIRENLAKNNALFAKLKDGSKVKFVIEPIDPDEQTKQMAEKLKERLAKRVPNRKDEMQKALDDRLAAHYRSQKDIENINSGKYPTVYKSDLDT